MLPGTGAQIKKKTRCQCISIQTSSYTKSKYPSLKLPMCAPYTRQRFAIALALSSGTHELDETLPHTPASQPARALRAGSGTGNGRSCRSRTRGSSTMKKPGSSPRYSRRVRTASCGPLRATGERDQLQLPQGPCSPTSHQGFTLAQVSTSLTPATRPPHPPCLVSLHTPDNSDRKRYVGSLLLQDTDEQKCALRLPALHRALPSARGRAPAEESLALPAWHFLQNHLDQLLELTAQASKRRHHSGTFHCLIL